MCLEMSWQGSGKTGNIINIPEPFTETATRSYSSEIQTPVGFTPVRYADSTKHLICLTAGTDADIGHVTCLAASGAKEWWYQES